MATFTQRAALQFNKGVRSFGINVVMDHLTAFAAANGSLPVVSVGSGMGAVEALTDRVSWMLIDPEPMSFANHPQDSDGWGAVEPLRMPDFPSVQALLSDKPNIVGNCLLFLNWCEPNDSEYDYEAIEMLKPRGVLTIVELWHGMSGAAGGDHFHEWLHLSRSLKSDTGFRVLMESTLNHHRMSTTPMDIRIVWLQRTGDGVAAPSALKSRYDCAIPHTGTDCTIC